MWGQGGDQGSALVHVYPHLPLSPPCPSLNMFCCTAPAHPTYKHNRQECHIHNTNKHPHRHVAHIHTTHLTQVHPCTDIHPPSTIHTHTTHINRMGKLKYPEKTFPYTPIYLPPSLLLSSLTRPLFLSLTRTYPVTHPPTHPPGDREQRGKIGWKEHGLRKMGI